MKKNPLILAIPAIIFTTIVTSQIPSFAQESPGQGIGPSAERFKKESEQLQKDLQQKEVTPPKIKIEEPKSQAVPEGVSFTLKEVTVTGSTLFKPEVFTPIYSPYLEKTVNYKDLDDIMTKIKAKYKELGYLTTTAYLPEQDITGGKIEIKIIEGKMGDLSIEGSKYFKNSLIKSYIHVKKNELLNINTLQRDILRINKNPDLNLGTVISAGKEPETSDITLKATEKFPYHFGVGWDTLGTRLIGKDRKSVWVRSTNLGDNELLFVSAQFTKSSSGEFLSYVFPMGTYGRTAGIDLTYYEMKNGKEFKLLDITGQTFGLTPHVSQELSLSERYQAQMDLGLEIKSITKKIGLRESSDDQLRLPYLGFNFSKLDSLFGGGQTVFAPKWTFGTSNFLGASTRNHPSASRANTGGFWARYEMGLQRVQRLPFESRLSLNAQYQAASHTLPSSEQFQIGGANTVRGYPEGDYLADRGYFASAEWTTPMYLIPKKWKVIGQETPLRYLIEPVFFADVGQGTLKKIIPGELKTKFLLGYGVGLRIRAIKGAYFRLDWAMRRGDAPTSNSGRSTFNFSFQYDI
ncbi:MAG: ShlB/FhaC/HecB family hemolysin secretion/activation protein [Candidatus Omnitrophota bacterium]